ncbi:hypothetical protein [Ferruginibacter sp. SUN106]|uniref:hypothetical protein n=1 Tax=Ferruginibacter sp. SUN106 TaxID=2978348 RepID=UPI003D36BCA8
MFNLFKKKSKYPDFRILNTFHKKSFYFHRHTEWAIVDNESLLVTDPKNLDMITLNGWKRDLFMAADGKQTIEAFIYFVADQYTGTIPYNLDHLIIWELLELEKKNLIVLSKTQEVLPTEFEMPGLAGIK